MSKSKRELKEEVKWLQEQLDSAWNLGNKYYENYYKYRYLHTAQKEYIAELEQELKEKNSSEIFKDFLKDLMNNDDKKCIADLEKELIYARQYNEELKKTQEKPWTWVTDDPESLPKESGWYQIYHEIDDTHPTPVTPYYYSKDYSITRDFAIAWKQLSDPPKEGER